MFGFFEKPKCPRCGNTNLKKVKDWTGGYKLRCEPCCNASEIEDRLKKIEKQLKGKN